MEEQSVSHRDTQRRRRNFCIPRSMRHSLLFLILIAAVLSTGDASACCVACDGFLLCGCSVSTSCGSCEGGCGTAGSEEESPLPMAAVFEVNVSVKQKSSELYRIRPEDEIRITTEDEHVYFIRLRWGSDGETIIVVINQEVRLLWMRFERTLDTFTVPSQVPGQEPPLEAGPFAISSIRVIR